MTDSESQLGSPSAEARNPEQLRQENAALRARLAEAEASLRLLRAESGPGRGDANAWQSGPPISADPGSLPGQTSSETEDRLRFVLETIHAGAWELDLDTRRAFRSVEHDRIFGYPALLPEWTYEAFLSHVVPEDRTALDARFQRAIDSEEEWSLECRIRRADGQLRWIWAAGRQLHDARGRRMAGIVQDITERKRTEESLRQAQANLENFLNTATTGLVRTSADLRYISVNRAFSELVGLPASQIVGRRLVDVLGETAFDRIRPYLERVRRGERVEYEAQLHFPQTGPKWIHGSYNPEWRDGEVVGWVASITDFTARKKAEEAMRAAEELARQRLAELEDLYRNAPVGLCALDRDLRFLRINERLAEINGIAAAAHVGKTVRELLPELADAVEPDMRRILATGEPKLNIEIFGETPAQPGVPRSWMEQWLPITDADGRVTGLSIVVEETTARRAAEEAQRMALARAETGERMLEALMANVPEGITLCDADGKLKMVSQHGQVLLGRPHDGKHIDEVVAEWNVFRRDGETPLPMDEIPAVRALKGEIVRDFELVQLTADGRRLPLLCNAAPIRNAAGQVVLAVVAWRDISERMQAEKAQRESEERLRLLGDNLPDSALYQYVHEADGGVRFIYVSAGIERLNGVTAEEILGDAGALHRQIQPEHMARLIEAEARSKRELSDFDAEVPMRRPNGETRWMHLHSRPRRLPDGRIIWDGVQIDVTERRAAEAALRESELRYRTLVDATSAVSWSCPPSGLQVAPQPAWMAFTGQSAEEMLGTGWSRAVHPDDVAVAGARWREAVESGQPFVSEHRIRCHDGQWRWMSVHAAPIRGGEGEVADWIGMCLDVTDRRATEDALRQSERRFRQVTESLPQLVWTCAALGPCDYLSPQWVRYTGKSEAEQLGYGWLEQLHPDDRQRTIDHWQQTAAKGTTFEIEFRLRRHDGAYRWFRTLAVPLCDEAGNIVKWFGSNTDIEAIKQAEAALRESEERFRLFMDNSPTIAWVKDEDGRHVYLSRAYEKRFGVRLDDWRGKTDADLWPAETAAEFRKNDLAVLAASHPLQVTEVTHEPDGSRCYWLNNKFPFRDATGRRYVAGIGLDITALKQAEDELRSSETRYRAIGESLPYGVWACDAQGRNTYASESFLRLVGLTQQQCADFGWGELLHPDDADRTIAAWKECARTGGKWDIEHRYLGVDGKYHDILARGVPIRGEHGEITSWAGINLDISRLKNTERALQDAQAQLQAYAQELEDRVARRTARLEETIADLEHFSYAITHDMRAPLRAMQGFSHLLEEDHGDILSADGRDYLRRIRSAADRLDRLITDALDYSKTVSEQPALESVDLDRLIPDLVDSYPHLQPRQADITIAGPLPVVRGTTAYLTQCFANLLGNAVKFAKPDRRPRILVWGEPSPLRPEMARIWVEDEGIGIPPESLGRIFGLFQRAATDREGTGIGLAIVRKVVERMGGQVGVESTEGQGSRFWVDLPPISGEARGRNELSEEA